MDLSLRHRQAEAWLLLGRLHTRVSEAVTAQFRDEGIADITPAQANALMVLFQRRHPLTARQLAGELGVSEVTVGRFVRRLEAGGWVERTRDPDDGRAILLRTTRKARTLLPAFVRLSNQMMDQLFAGFSPDEVAQLQGLLARLQENTQPDNGRGHRGEPRA